MLRYVKQNIFNSPAQVIVNTVNTVGVMGKGIAKEYKDFYPDMFERYREFCEKEMFNIGQLWLYKTQNKWILNFPTKKHWRNPSKIEYIEQGLKKFVETYEVQNIKSISFPQLGVGNGGLNWENEVKPLMEKYLSDLPIDIFIHLYSPNQEKEKEHLNQKDMKEWLNSSPTNLSFNEVKYDIENSLFRSSKICQLVINSELVEVHPLESASEESNVSLVFHYIERDTFIPIYYTEFFEYWNLLRSQGFVSTKDLAEHQLKNYKEIFTVFDRLPYLEVIESFEQLKQTNSPISELILIFSPMKINIENSQEVVSYDE